MFEKISKGLEEQCQLEEVLIREGDAVMWHPALMHCGLCAMDNRLTRNSIVCHLIPEGVNVRDDKLFSKDFYNLPTYGLIQYKNSIYVRG